MKNYMISIKTTPVIDGNWDNHYHFIDNFPGSALVENPDTPEIVFDINARNWNETKNIATSAAVKSGIDIISIEKIEESPLGNSTHQNTV